MGGLFIGFGPDQTALQRRTGGFVECILKGVDPTELPVELPDRFELLVNLRTATASGLELMS